MFSRMKKVASELKKGDKVLIGGDVLTVNVVENSDIGKQGTKKTRIEAVNSKGEKIAMIRPADYPFNCE